MIRGYYKREALGRGRHMHIAIEQDTFDVTLLDLVQEEGEGVEDGGRFDESLAGIKVRARVIPLTLDALRSRQEFRGPALWHLASVSDIPLMWYNRYARTYAERMESGVDTNLDGFNGLVQLLVPFTDADFTEMGVKAFMPFAEGKVFCNLPMTELSEQEANSGIIYLPSLVLTGPDQIIAGQIATFTVSPYYEGEPTTRSLEVEIESVNGYVPKTRFTINGPQDFKIRALDLDPGDTIRLKAGYRYRSSVVAKDVAVI
jgi:hypothetical protein